MNPQKRLARPKTIILIAIVLIAVLMLLFQKEERLTALFEQVTPDHLSVLYLQLLMEMNPDKAELRIAVARQQSMLGQLEQAHITLKPLLEQEDADAIRARLLSIEIDMKRYFAIPPSDPARKSELLKLQGRMASIAAENLPVDTLPEAIKMSLELNFPSIAAMLYEIRATVDTNSQHQWLKEAGRWYIASGNPQQAHQLFKSAFDTTIETNLSREYALLSLQALRAADRGKEALKFVQHYLNRLPRDRALLDSAVALALEVNKPDLAVRWGALLLALNTEDPIQIAKQVDLALAASDLSLALQLSKRLIELKPEDEKIRLHTAQIAEWSGKHQEALAQWQWLARKTGDDASISHALRLAKGLYQGEAVIEILNLKSKQHPLTRDEIHQLLDAYGEADPNQLLEILRNYLIRHPGDCYGWEILATMQTDSGQLDDALSTWQQITTRFGLSGNTITRQAKLLWRMWKPEQAFTVLSNYRIHAKDQESEFWKLLGNLAWQLEHSEAAYQAYQTVWESDHSDTLTATRLINLARDMNQFSQATALSEQSYQRFKQPRWLILAMDSAVQSQSWQELGRLINIANDKAEQFENLDAYWLMRAQLASHDRHLKSALAHYRRALKINPQSADARGGLLWTLINGYKKQLLARYLRKWLPDAQSQPALWGAFAAGFAKLDQPEHALPWFKRQAIRKPNDYLWLLSYADALDGAHKADSAWGLRMHVFTRLRAHFNQNPVYLDNRISEASLKRAYLTLRRRLTGVASESNVLKRLFAKGKKDPAAQELVIGSLLSQENFEAARYWLLQTHTFRQQLPAWQQLTVALADNDLTSVEQILETKADALTPLNRIEGLKRTGESGQALTLAHNLLEANADQSSESEIHRQRNELLLQQARQAVFSWDLKSLGALDIQQSLARFSIPFGNGKWTVQVGYNRLDVSGEELLLPASNEIDLSIAGRYQLSRGLFNFKAGGNVRDDESLLYGTMQLTHNFSDALKGSFSLGLNEISYETTTLRALGARDKVSLGLSAQLSKQLLLQFDIDGHRYITRHGTKLGEGYKVNLNLVNTLVFGDPTWQVRLQGAWESNHLPEHLPSELSSSLISPSASLEDIVTPEYGAFGIGTTFRYGSTEQGFVRRPFVLADIWTGWVWPSNALAYNGRLALGLSLFGPDVLSFNAFYGNVQGGRTEQAYRGLGVQYEIRF